MSQTTLAPAKLRRAPWYVFVSAWAVPVLILGQFAMLAALPVVVLIVATFRSARLRALRWWVSALAAVYAAPLAVWILRPDRAPSLSKDMSPIFAALIVAVSIAVVVKLYTRRKR